MSPAGRRVLPARRRVHPRGRGVLPAGKGRLRLDPDGGEGRLLRSTCTVSRTPAKRADVRDVKKKGYLPVLEPLPHSGLLEMSGGHSGGLCEGHGAHPDRVGAADTMAPFIPFSNTLCTLYCETLKESREQKKWRPLC
jgi:hypothetical protein